MEDGLQLPILFASFIRRFQCSDCNPDSPTNVRFLSVAGARRHYRESHHNRPLICWVCKGNHASEAALLAHLAAQHPDVVGGAEDEAQGCVVCLHCPSVFSTHAQRVEHTRHAHLVETIDITTTDLDEVRPRRWRIVVILIPIVSCR